MYVCALKGGGEDSCISTFMLLNVSQSLELIDHILSEGF